MTPGAAGDIPDPGPRRRYGSRPLPPYRFVPGRHPHPTRDPAGHSYDARPGPNRHAPWRPCDWRLLDDWIFGVDLFNARYFWEAHEAWEGLWAAQPRDSAAALFLQGLIQIAAALLKAHLRQPAGVRVLSAEGLAKLRGVAAESPAMMGLDLDAAVAELAAYFAAAPDGLPDLARAPQLRLEEPRG